MGGGLVLHAQPRIQWQGKRAAFFLEGLRRKGIRCEVTDSQTRIDDRPAVLLGTTLWRDVESTGPYLLVDRCSFGDTETFVSLVWNGHGRRGDHKVPHGVDGSRWESMGIDLVPWRQSYSRVVLCGQEQSYCDTTLDTWYSSVKATHFRRHPVGGGYPRLPETSGLDDSLAVTLNSSIAVQCVLNGIPTVTMDEGSMAWDVTGHGLKDVRFPDREPWCHRLAWTQWSDDEIREGYPWAFLL